MNSIQSLKLRILGFPTLFWVLFVPFVWAIFCGALFQFYIYPVFFQSTYWGHGLVQGDWVFFHQKAVEFAQTSTLTHMNFTLVPLFLSPVYLLGVVYFITNIFEPWVFLPVGALIHSLSILCLFSILRELKFSAKIALLAAMLYNFLPSSVILLSQFHRDGIVFLAYFSFVLFLLRAVSGGFSAKNILLILSSVLLMFLFRTYLLNFYFVILLGCFPYLLYFRKRAVDYRSLLLLPIMLFCIFLGQFTGQMSTVDHSVSKDSSRLPAEVAWCVAENSFDMIFPAIVRNQFCSLQTLRTRAVANFPEAVSPGYFAMFAYKDLRIDTPTRFFLALPTLVKIAYLEPIVFLSEFKTHWTLFNYVSYFETWLSFTLACLCLLSAFYKKNRLALLPILVSTFFLMLIAASTVNMASFYRVKYGYSVLVSAIGLAFLLNLLFKDKKPENS